MAAAGSGRELSCHRDGTSASAVGGHCLSSLHSKVSRTQWLKSLVEMVGSRTSDPGMSETNYSICSIKGLRRITWPENLGVSTRPTDLFHFSFIPGGPFRKIRFAVESAG